MLQHIHTPRLPILDMTSVSTWLLEVHSEAVALGVSSTVVDQLYEYDSIHHCSVAALTRAIIASLPKEVVNAIATPKSPINPARIINQVQICYQTCTEAEHSALVAVEDRFCIEDYKIIAGYFCAHENVRAKVVEADYPGIG